MQQLGCWTNKHQKVHLTDKLDQRRQHYAKLVEKEAHQDD